MTTLLLTVGVLGVCFAGMGIGHLLQSRRGGLKGSCGGASSKGRPPGMECAACGGDSAQCETKQSEDANPASRSSGRV